MAVSTRTALPSPPFRARMVPVLLLLSSSIAFVILGFTTMMNMLADNIIETVRVVNGTGRAIPLATTTADSTLFSYHTTKTSYYNNNTREVTVMSRRRRKLAALDYEGVRIDANSKIEVTLDEMWKSIANDTLDRERSLIGIYALHVSKSGGTSLCDLMKAEKCFLPPDRKGKANCWSKKYETDSIDLGTQWVRKAHTLDLNFPVPPWMLYDEENTPSSSCQDIRDYLSTHNHLLAMSENWLPTAGLCTNDFLNVVILRHPLERVLSHYRHIYNKCLRMSDQNSCSQMIVDEKYFDFEFMNKTFDIITDNYYTRSLNGQGVYSHPSGLPRHFLHTAKENLRDFDWVLLLGLEYTNSTQEIVLEGMGLSKPLPVSRQVSADSKKIHFKPQDIQLLEKMNVLDLELWEEAIRLHRLDFLSVQKMRSILPSVWQQRFEIQKNIERRCCGVVCDKSV